LRKLATEACPDLDERLLGKYVSVRQPPGGEELAAASYVEIETYAREILEQLAPQVPARPAARSSHRHAGAPWGSTEDERLLRAFDDGRTVAELAAAHLRSEGAIRSRLMRLGRLTLVPSGATAPTPAPQQMPAASSVGEESPDLGVAAPGKPGR